MKVAGIDIGHYAVKAVIIEGEEVVSQALRTTMGIKSSIAAEKVFDEALRIAGFSRNEIEYIVATGHGRKGISFAQQSKPVAICLAKGTHWLFPSVRTVIDVGYEVCNVVALNEDGKALAIQENDKCAGGSGSFIESMSKFLKMSPHEMSKIALRAERPVSFNSQCVVFCEQEFISHVHSEEPIPEEDLVGGIYESLASRLAGLAMRVTVKEDLGLSGGAARFPAFVKAMEKQIGLKANVTDNPEMVLAIGAALFAKELCAEGGRK